MKIAVLVGDGMGDYPHPDISNQTALQAARIPNIRRLCAAGEVRMVYTVPDGMYPGSDAANMALMGYDPAEKMTGRGPIEAAGAAIPMTANEIAFRCNLVTIENGLMIDHSSGHISNDEASRIIKDIQAELGDSQKVFHNGVSYRHILLWDHGPEQCTTNPPHELIGQPVADNLPAGKGADQVRALMDASCSILEHHPVNQARIKEGKNPATQIWLWGQGRALALESYGELYGLTGGVITAVDLVRGLGNLAGLQAVDVPGATGLIDTNYEGKVEAALQILEDNNFVYVHVEAPDECGHMGDLKLKIKAIELFDEKVVGPVWETLELKGEPYRILICTDHRTPVSTRGHSPEPVPLAKTDGPTGPVEQEAPFDETVNGGEAQGMAHNWIRELLGGRS